MKTYKVFIIYERTDGKKIMRQSIREYKSLPKTLKGQKIRRKDGIFWAKERYLIECNPLPPQSEHLIKTIFDKIIEL